ncbi:MAG: hypothetical protein AB4372_23185 [Xenococcus sp. (in: cyanobacteria)]
MQVTINIDRELFRFKNKQEWVNKASSWYSTCGVDLEDTIAVDSIGRVMRTGHHFAIAEYPVIVYLLGGNRRLVSYGAASKKL